MRSGKFIVIDGSDGAGKKTQSDLLIAFLKEKKFDVSYYDFPQYDQSLFGQMVGRYLNGEFGEADDVSPYLSSLLYAGDRWCAADRMKKDLENGKLIISNRYTQSNMAFQSAKIADPQKKEDFLNWLEKLEFEIYNIPKPDLVIYLYMPYKISQALVDKKDARNYTQMTRDIHEKNGDFLQRVEKAYLDLAQKNPEWAKIDCCENDQLMPIEKISRLVQDVVENRLNLKNNKDSIFDFDNLMPMEELAS